MKKITKCPHCESDWGVYTKQTLINVPHNMNFDGSDGYNGEMYDNAEKLISGALVYCQKCDKVVCRLSTFERNIERNCK